MDSNWTISAVAALSGLGGSVGTASLFMLFYKGIWKLIDSLQIRIKDLESDKVSLREDLRKCEERHNQTEKDMTELREVLVNQNRVSGIVIVDQTGKIVEWGPGATRMFHWTSDEAVGRSVNMLVPPQYRDRHMKGFAKFTADASSEIRREPLITYALTKDDEHIPVIIYLSSWEDGGKKFLAATIESREVFPETNFTPQKPPTPGAAPKVVI